MKNMPVYFIIIVILILLIISSIYAAEFSVPAKVTVKKSFVKPRPECGNGVCEPRENPRICPIDCLPIRDKISTMVVAENSINKDLMTTINKEDSCNLGVFLNNTSSNNINKRFFSLLTENMYTLLLKI